MSQEESNIVVWGDADQRTVLADAAQHASCRIRIACGPTSDDAADLARDLGCERASDLRQALLDDDITGVWLTSRTMPSEDVNRIARERELVVFTTEPWPGSLGETVAGEVERRHVAPLMRHSPGYRAAEEVFDTFGERRSVSIAFRSGSGEGTLFARLFDAMDIIWTLCGRADQIDATLVGETPETLRSMSGHLTANLRFSEDRCAGLALSNAAGAWFRGVTLLGDAGCLRIHDSGFEWIGPDGDVVDHHHDDHSIVGFGALFGDQWQRHQHRRDGQIPPVQRNEVLALCEATRLSCRTGQPEIPRKMLEMLTRP